MTIIRTPIIPSDDGPLTSYHDRELSLSGCGSNGLKVVMICHPTSLRLNMVSVSERTLMSMDCRRRPKDFPASVSLVPPKAVSVSALSNLFFMPGL